MRCRKADRLKTLENQVEGLTTTIAELTRTVAELRNDFDYLPGVGKLFLQEHAKFYGSSLPLTVASTTNSTDVIERQ